MKDKEFVIKKLSEKDKRTICSWRYEGAYAVYNLPSFEELKKREQSFMNCTKESGYRAFYLRGQLIGYSNIRREDNGVYIGVGVAPKLCGRGYGQQIVNATVELARREYRSGIFYLEVRSWNVRAIKCYEKCGFQIVGDLYFKEISDEKISFYRMQKSLARHIYNI
ncbi:MAG: GNAT family N-acetyltransferase [Clostridia bacterium]|nr:GNAT family N-acetyltransferase [Clostridia bacterium]